GFRLAGQPAVLRGGGAGGPRAGRVVGRVRLGGPAGSVVLRRQLRPAGLRPDVLSGRLLRLGGRHGAAGGPRGLRGRLAAMPRFDPGRTAGKITVALAPPVVSHVCRYNAREGVPPSDRSP